MKAADEFTLFAPGAGCWHAYDPDSKVELWSTAVAVSGGAILVDPIALTPEARNELTASLGTPVAIVLTNGNHARASASFALPIYADNPAHRSASELSLSWADLGVLSLPGAGEGELAVTFAPLRLAIVGDAVINLEEHGFMPLPAKYCTDAKQARLSLRHLIDYAPERLAFAHGSPIVAGAAERLRSMPL